VGGKWCGEREGAERQGCGLTSSMPFRCRSAQSVRPLANNGTGGGVHGLEVCEVLEWSSSCWWKYFSQGGEVGSGTWPCRGWRARRPLGVGEEVGGGSRAWARCLGKRRGREACRGGLGVQEGQKGRGGAGLLLRLATSSSRPTRAPAALQSEGERVRSWDVHLEPLDREGVVEIDEKEGVDRMVSTGRNDVQRFSTFCSDRSTARN